MKNEVEQMAHLWNAGCSMAQIASHFSMSRGKVSGLISRNREMFSKRHRSAMQKANERRSAFQDAKASSEAEVAPVEQYGAISKEEADAYDACRLPMAKDLLALGPCDCRWPVNDGGPFLFCCAEANTLSPYCEHHARRSKGQGTRSEQRAVKDARMVA